MPRGARFHVRITPAALRTVRQIDPRADGAMDAEQALSALIAEIYDAALDPPSWRKVLKGVCGFVRGGPSASLFWQDSVKKAGKTFYVYGGEPRFNQLYWDKYVTLNP